MPANTKAAQLAAMVNKALGTTAITMGSGERHRTQYLPTGLLPIDIAMGGGLPRGRMVEVYGSYSTLKSYIGYNAIAQIQRRGGVAALVDTERTYDEDWAISCGVDPDQLIIVEGETGEEKLDTAHVLVSNGLDLLVVDSIAAILPEAEHKKRLHKESVQPGRTAALMSIALRKLTAANDKTAFMWINQVREQVGVVFGSPEKAPGGRAMGFYASIRLKISGAGKITEDIKTYTGDGYKTSKQQIGQSYKAVVEKSKLSAPFKEVFFDWDLTEGKLDLVKFVFAQAVQHNIVTGKGSSWSYGNVKVQGREKFMERIGNDAALMAELEEAVRVANGLAPLKKPPVSRSLGKSAAVKKKVAGSKRLH